MSSSRMENVYFGCSIALAAGLFAVYASSTKVPFLIDSHPIDHPEQLFNSERSRALRHLLAAFGPNGANAPGTSAGVMIASPSRPASYLDKETENANYFFHWTRDANLCLRVVIQKLREAELGYNIGNHDPESIILTPSSVSTIDALETILQDSICFNNQLQQVLNLSGGPLDGGLGEPKFMVDGSRFNEPWSRPQNDGPAIRASTMIQYAQYLINERNNFAKSLHYIESHLYQAKNPNSQIRLDIDHVCRTWNQPSSDLWEEVKADNGGHFYTLMVQRKSVQDLINFTKLLPSEKQPSEQDYEFYFSTISKMDQRLEMFWNPEGLPDREGGKDKIPNNKFLPFSNKPHIVPTLDRMHGQPKPSQVDTAVLLAINHTAGTHQPANWSPHSDRTLATLDRLVEVFEKLYPINQSKKGTGIAIGRYPEDEYDGVNSNSVGHPWFLCTHAVAETTYLAIQQFRKSLSISVTPINLAFLSRFLPELTGSFDSSKEPITIDRGSDKFRKLLSGMSKWADQILLDVSFKFFSRSDGKMSEQIDRTTGKMRGARELTWSYASLLTCLDVREVKVLIY